MAGPTVITDILDGWIASNADRLSNRFTVARSHTWHLADRQGVYMDLEGEFALGQVTFWPERIAEAEAMHCNDDSRSRVTWTGRTLSTELLDAWLSALEALDRECPPIMPIGDNR